MIEAVTTSDGRFKPGERRSIATEFKKGQHWREKGPHWEKEWLEREYLTKQRSAAEIAKEVGCKENNILFWLKKHGIPRRDVKTVRSLKHWGASGADNPMYGKRGAQSSNWKGGCTPERQSFYTSREWKLACAAVWKRDTAQCQRCTARGKDAKMHVHHIVPFRIAALRAEPSNLVLLCRACHRFVHSKKNVSREFIGKEGS